MIREDFRAPSSTRIRSGWNPSALMMRGPLTDQKIALYEKRGYYDPAFRAARRDMWEKRQARRTQRDGSFDLIEGRMIYRP